MKPYYQDKWVTIYHGDCREILPRLDVKVDLVLTDPPYSISSAGGRRGFKGKVFLDESWDSLDASEWFPLLPAVLKDSTTMLIWGNHTSLFRLPLEGWYIEYIRKRAMKRCFGCERCHRRKADYKELDCAHFHTRKKYATRWHEDNAVGLCSGCHFYIDGQQPKICGNGGYPEKANLK